MRRRETEINSPDGCDRPMRAVTPSRVPFPRGSESVEVETSRVSTSSEQKSARRPRSFRPALDGDGRLKTLPIPRKNGPAIASSRIDCLLCFRAGAPGSKPSAMRGPSARSFCIRPQGQLLLAMLAAVFLSVCPSVAVAAPASQDSNIQEREADHTTLRVAHRAIDRASPRTTTPVEPATSTSAPPSQPEPASPSSQAAETASDSASASPESATSEPGAQAAAETDAATRTAFPIRIQPPSSSTPAATPNDSEPSGLLPATRDLIEKRRENLAKEVAQIESEIERLPSADPSQHEVQLLGYMRYLDSVYAQQQVVAENEVEARADAEKFDRERQSIELLGTEAARSYTFLALEQLRDQRDDSRIQLNLADSEQESMQAFIASVREQYASNERQRRQLNEKLESEDDPAKQTEMRQQLRLLELRRRIGDELLRLRAHEVQVNQLKRDISEKRIQLLDQLIPTIETVVQFTQTDLNQALARLDEEQNFLNQQLSKLQSAMREVESLAAQTLTDDDSGDSQDTELVRTIRRSLHRGIAQTNESFTNILVLRYIWKARFRVHNELATPAEMEQFRTEVRQFTQRTQSAENTLSAHQQEARLELDVSSRRPSNGPPSDLQTLRSKTLSEWFRLAGSRQRMLRGSLRVFERLDMELSKRLDGPNGRLTLSRVWPLLVSWWQFELLVVDDRSITVGKLLAALLLFSTGLFVSRLLSRVVGTRMLPRIGVHQGASLAVQTISFYSLILLFGLVTLELLNIPITVLTFFGGAAAIAVGFGSQNILNNFMSGLIILGEQPIRVGDLIEVDGLHGTIEHIGARSTRVRTGRNFDIIIPNSRFLENNVKNMTLSSNEIRTVVRITVALGSDVDMVMRLLREVTVRQPYVLRRPEPIVLFTELASDAMAFEVHFWVYMRTLMDSLQAESGVRTHIERALREANIGLTKTQKDARHADPADTLTQRRAA